jgi:3-isopropylmalate dehydrogenase
MPKYKIAWMPGDGVGNDVMEAARLVLDKLGLDAEYPHADIGWEFWRTEGDPLPQRTLDLLKKTDCALFGAITSKPRDEAAKELIPELQGKGYDYRSPIVRLRQEFDLFVNRRPCKAYPGNPLNYKDDIDLVIFRENTEGLYVGLEWNPVPDNLWNAIKAENPKAAKFDENKLEDMAISMRLMTRKGCERILRAAFDYAKEKGYPTVTLVEKPNVLRETGGLITDVARKLAEEYPGIDLWETNIDAMCMWLIKNPEDYGVLVSENMFGDIISDEAAQLVGGLGFACSGNIGTDYAVFEPTHGSAPKYDGQYKVNPMAMLLAAYMMIDWLGETDMAKTLESAIAAVIAEGKVRTYDMGGTSGTMDVAEAVVEKL